MLENPDLQSGVVDLLSDKLNRHLYRAGYIKGFYSTV